jgi:cytochrome c553
MRTSVSILALSAASFFSSTALGAEGPPAWAYPVNPPDLKPRADDGIARHVPASSATYSVTQLRDRFIAPVWHPADHPPLPSIVAEGRKPNVFACGFCHRAEGTGGPENASLAGLPAATSSSKWPTTRAAPGKPRCRKENIDLMISLSKDITDAEVQAAAAYFSALKPRSNVRVVETATVPKTSVAGWFLAASNTGEKESIGQRIIEVPEDVEQFETATRDPSSSRMCLSAASHEGGPGQQRWRGQDTAMRDLPWPGLERPRQRALDRRTFAQLCRASALRHPERRTCRYVGAAHESTVANLTVEDMASIAAYLASRPR